MEKKTDEEKTSKPSNYQLRALFRKNATLQLRQKKTNCFQLSVPIVLVTLVGLIQIVYDIYMVQQFDDYHQVIGYPVDMSLTPSCQYFGDFNLGMYLSNDPQQNSTIGYIDYYGFGYGMFGNITQYSYSSGRVPYFSNWYENSTELDKSIFDLKNYWEHDQRTYRCNSCPVSAFVVNNFTNIDLDYVVMVDEQLGRHPDKSRVSSMNLIHQTFVTTIMNSKNWLIHVYEQSLPYVNSPPEADFSSIVATLLYPFAVSFLLPVYAYAIVLEKQDRLREMMKMMGMQMHAFWFVNYVFDFFLYLIVFIALAVISLAFRVRFFTQTSPILLILIFLGWGYTQIGFSILVSTLFSRVRSVTIVSYLLVIASVITSYVVNLLAFNVSELPPLSYLFFPPFVFYRAIYVMGSSCGIFQCFRMSDVYPGSQMFWLLIYLYAEGFILMIISIYLDAIIPQEYGIAKHPLFFLKPIKKLFTSKLKNDHEMINIDEKTSFLQQLEEGSNNGDEDNDVDAQIRLAHTIPLKENLSLVVRDLKKTYAGGWRIPSKTAIKSLCLCLKSNECFGLLGPNGAGKTTLISILTGLYPPTSGTAIVAGFDINENMDEIHRIISVCPQFDTFWESLTTKETTLFYARLKGISPAEENDHALKVLESVGLLEFQDRQAKDLSGGMKRRLSLAIAFVGNPALILLDEPTTGLDPETRRGLWDTLLDIKKEKSIIITTHSMEEADILCDRIGIMSLGELKCIGTSLFLKNRYGVGYSLSINFYKEKRQQVQKFIQEVLPEAQESESYDGFISLKLKSGTIKIYQLFSYFEKMKNEIGIIDWGINQTSLEDVFMNVAQVNPDD
eukprot:TRINITY_DN3648_c0_g3_i1.p1 TRINITY_DN3648_c0_g3~~TRINITY_DN3648_c0_g3_i1.p1  ORF type:complete len:851 (-),score=271.54 TRINITY_DN3648_c0_g3_i1:91-2613(-)